MVTRKIPHKPGRFVWNDSIRFLIADEAHRCGALRSQNAEMLIAAKRQGIKILMLSATLAGGPLSLRAIGYALDLFPLTLYWRWAQRHGVGRLPGLPGMHWAVGAERKLAIMAKLRSDILPSRGVAVSTRDIPGFPNKEINCGLYDVTNSKEIDRLYEQMLEPLSQLDEATKADVSPDSPITKVLRMRQRIEILKVPLAIELGEDYLAKGMSVVWFVNFKQTLEEIRKRAGVECFIDGSNKPGERDAMIARFQSNECRTLVANAASGGVGVSLHDLHGMPRVGIVFPSYDAVITRQVFGRLHRDGAKSPALYQVLFVANSIEERIHRVLSAKLNNLDSLNSADLSPENLALRE